MIFFLQGDEMKKIIRITPLLLLILACATTGPGRKSFILIPTPVEKDLGREVAKEVESEEKLLDNSEVQSYVNSIGQRLARVCDRRDLRYTFKVIAKDEINAFACPGGHIYIYTGLLKILDNEAQLAAILGHEVGHVVARHSVKQLQKVYGYNILMEIALGDKMGKAARQAVDGSVGLILLGFGRKNEFEADELGTLYTKKAGLNPQAMIQVFEKFKKMEGSPPSTLEKLLSTHPPTSERISNCKKQINKIGGTSLPYNEESFKRIVSLIP